jgi:endonuclease YncB( thermonuclease family)
MLKTHHLTPYALAALVALTIAPAHAGQLQGVVVSVADGDTITVLDAEQRQHKIRLAGIDCPEKKQAFGQVAKHAMAELVYKKQVRVDTRKYDRYGRTIGVVWTTPDCQATKCPKQVDAGLELLTRGLAWHYKQYEKEQPTAERHAYAAAERQARQQNAGLWRDPLPVPPWDWRKQKK